MLVAAWRIVGPRKRSAIYTRRQPLAMTNAESGANRSRRPASLSIQFSRELHMRFQCASAKLPFLLVAFLCCLVLTPTANAQAQFAYVTNDGGSIELIDTTTNSVINTLQLPGVAAPYKATSVAVTPDGNK